MFLNLTQREARGPIYFKILRQQHRSTYFLLGLCLCISSIAYILGCKSFPFELSLPDGIINREHLLGQSPHLSDHHG